MKVLTVITVTYNAELTIEKTLLSVLRQTVFDEQINYIVVDGDSKDGTMKYIQANSSKIDKIIHEPDHGIFDAMNKGAAMAQTPWIMFLNAGDEFYSNDTVESLHLELREPDHILYGDCIRVYTNGQQEYRKAQPFFKLKNCIPGIGICHQSIYIPADWMNSHPYQWQRFPHCADFEQIYAFWNEKRRFEYIDRPLCLYSYGDGFSSKPEYFSKVFEENAHITQLNHSWIFYRQKLRNWLSSL